MELKQNVRLDVCYNVNSYVHTLIQNSVCNLLNSDIYMLITVPIESALPSPHQRISELYFNGIKKSPKEKN